jgi:ABC-type microcin C transport system duplicated ATPase subunit YejF
MSETQTSSAEAPTAELSSNGNELLRIDDLVKHFPIKAGVLKRTVGQVRAVEA